MKTALLSMLRNSDTYLSGQELCNYFGVSRTAIWKVINQLKDEGYVIEAVQNKGYRLIQSPDCLSSSEILSRLKTEYAGRETHYFSEIDSTNAKAKQLAADGAPHGTLVLADTQKEGKGRRGRNWSSPSGSGIWMSLIVRPEIIPSKASMLTLVMALSVSKALRELTGLTIQIKWPNDIVINGKKLCGILTEMSAEVDYIHSIVIGVGINVNTTDFPEELMQTATSFYLETGKMMNRSEIITEILLAFEQYYDTFIKSGDLSLLREEYNNNLINKNREVKIIQGKEAFTGISKGIEDNGELIVQKEDGTVVNVLSGEVSVRGVYGYV